MVQLLGLIRGTPTNPGLTLERMSRCVLAMPARWFAQSNDKRANPLIDQLQATSRVLQNGKHGIDNTAALESRLRKLLNHVKAA